MTHYYEIRKLEDDGKITTVRKMSAEPKVAKQTAKNYAKRNPGVYCLYKVEPVAYYFTAKEEN